AIYREARERAASNPTPRTLGDTHPLGATATDAAESAGIVPSVLPGAIGRFQVRQLLGEGGFGKVYLAIDPQLDRAVAIKVPRNSSLLDPQAVQRFLNEGKASAMLQHPSVCPIYEVGETDGQHYIVMAHVQGHSLAELLKQERVFDERRAAE